MLRSKGRREGIRLLVDQEIDPTLAIQGDRAAAMTGNRRETHAAEQRMQAGGIGGSKFDKLEAVDAQRGARIIVSVETFASGGAAGFW